MNDVDESGCLRGWADRCADTLSAEVPSFRYANLAVRGARARDVRTEQLPVAQRMRAELASVAVGINDMLRPTFDLDGVLTDVDECVAGLQQAGSQVLLFSFGDPRRRSRAFGFIADRVWQYRAGLLAIASTRGVGLVDFWGAPSFDGDRYWSSDRLHLSPAGHKLAALAALEALGMADAQWRTGGDADDPRRSFARRRVTDMWWFGAHVTPWLWRRVRPRARAGCRRPYLELYP